MKDLIDRIDNAAAVAGDSAAVRLRKTLLIFLGAAGVLLAPVAGYYLEGSGERSAALVAFVFAGVSAVGLVHMLVTKHEQVFAWLELCALLIAPFALQWFLGGFRPSGGTVLWSLLAPLCALVLVGTRVAVAWFGAFALLVLAAGARDVGTGVDLGTVLRFCENVLLVGVLAFIALRFFIIERERAQAALAREQERSERLLLNILPPPIAERLKEDGRSIADGYAQATILFADMVGFTKMSATVTPTRLVEILNSLFSRFDALCDRFAVEKIKTIGDAYMAVAGVPTRREDHAAAIADMALAMRQALAEHNREFGSALDIRIGINSGPVVAGVIGLKKFIYDLWGDTVNLASRMESHGVPGAIQVSRTTWEQLRDAYEFTPRPGLEVKGVGIVDAFILTGRKSAPARASS
ncbi:MAG: adenylate/guanylate cyclase domain-containing protein [Betaproteobacteria bacterium]|nr:adenylate/guanylate cyclase domain-containing protein [Betaproteobacteria bacterium]